MGAYTCQFGIIHRVCRCLTNHKIECDVSEEHRPKFAAGGKIEGGSSSLTSNPNVDNSYVVSKPEREEIPSIAELFAPEIKVTYTSEPLLGTNLDKLWCPTCKERRLVNEEFLTFLCEFCGQRSKLVPIEKETNLHGRSTRSR